MGLLAVQLKRESLNKKLFIGWGKGKEEVRSNSRVEKSTKNSSTVNHQRLKTQSTYILPAENTENESDTMLQNNPHE